MDTQMVLCFAVAEDHYSRDVEVYLPLPSGAEFKFRVWLDKEEDSIEIGEAEYAEKVVDPFDAYGHDVPASIRMCLIVSLQKVEAFLRNPKEKWVGSRMTLELSDHFTTVKEVSNG